jgi:hypothetical protein
MALKDELIETGLLFLASAFVMIVHEIVKSFVFVFRSPHKLKGEGDIFRLYHYIDPIGMLFCLYGYSGFSKPYMYRMRDRKTNLYVGILGFVTLILLALAGVILGNMIPYVFPAHFAQYVCVVSIGMFFANLFPISVFDLGLIIAGLSPEKFVSIIKNDYVIKTIFVLTVFIGVIRYFSVNIFYFLYERL